MLLVMDDSEVLFFATPAEWRRWLEEHHDTVQVLWVGFHKKGTGKPSITWPESVDEALCFGWIDGVRRSIDDSSYKIRFTPRRPGSTWSAVNIKRAQALAERGLMHPAGLEAFEARIQENSGIYEQPDSAALAPEFEEQLGANEKARSFFESQPPWYRRTAIRWVMSARQEATRLRRLASLIDYSAQGRTIPPLTRPTRPSPEPRSGNA
jgi:uncharacterized protein YdeI (YjbR/CyaY-like superfamily)